MKIKQLQSFITLIEKGSAIQASYHLNCSQASIAHHLTALEGDLGYDLFVRRKSFKTKEKTMRTDILNERGEILFKKAKILLSHYNEVMDIANKLK